MHQIYNIALEIGASTCGIATPFTYFQSLVKVEDVFGRGFPFSAEFSILALDAEIMIASRLDLGSPRLLLASTKYSMAKTK